MVLWLQALGDQGIHIHKRLQFAHQPLFGVDRYAELYDCAVSFGAPLSRLWLLGEGLYLPIPGHDEHLLARYRHHAERYEANTLLEGEFPQRVMLLFAQRMAFGKPQADDIAALLNVSRRTLQRQLREAGTSWSETIDRARQHAACNMLQQGDASVADLALLTGYEDTRAFLRAFKRWTGLTPSAYRATCQG
jgi:AraC-like DNA-binding protein